MAITVDELNAAVQEVLDKSFQKDSDLPAGYGRIFWTGFKEDQSNADIIGQIIVRPTYWKMPHPKKQWFYVSIALFANPCGGVYWRGMSFPIVTSAEPIEERWRSITEAQKLARLKAEQGVEHLRQLINGECHAGI